MATSSAIAWRGSQAVFLHSRVASTPLWRRCRLFGMSFFQASGDLSIRCETGQGSGIVNRSRSHRLDESPAGYSSVGLLSSIARLRFVSRSHSVFTFPRSSSKIQRTVTVQIPLSHEVVAPQSSPISTISTNSTISTISTNSTNFKVRAAFSPPTDQNNHHVNAIAIQVVGKCKEARVIRDLEERDSVDQSRPAA